MKLYVNGCSHTAAAEAVNPAAFAEDDGDLPNNWLLGRKPHPANLAVSYATQLANALGYELVCDAESASSNDRIIRTTTEWLSQHSVHDTLVVIQWSTWEREEWLFNNTWYQVNASGTDMVPPEFEQRYKEYIVGVDWDQKTREAHDKIWELHLELEDLEIPHVFFNGNNDFEQIQNRQDWGNSYIGPYSDAYTFNSVLKNNGFGYVHPQSYHFGVDAHRFWANYMLQYLQQNHFVTSNEIPTDRLI